MKFSRPFIALIALPLASAFGPATPVFAGGNSISNNNNDLTMRVSVSDMKRRRKITTLLDNVVVPNDPAATKQAIESTVITERTKTLLEDSNWKVRKAMLRKVRNLASKYDVAVDSSFGTPMPRLEREAIEAKEAAIKREARRAHFDQVNAERDARVAARRAAEAGTEADRKKKAAQREKEFEERIAAIEAEKAAIEQAERLKYEASIANAEEAEAEEEAKVEAKEEAKKEETEAKKEEAEAKED